MQLPSGLAEELTAQFANLMSIDTSRASVTPYQKIEGGADTIIFRSTFLPHDSELDKIDFVLRIYRESLSSDRAIREFNIMRKLHDAGVSLPEVYFTNPDDTVMEQIYLVMEYINGELLSDTIRQNTLNQEDLLKLLLEGMTQIHAIPWQETFEVQNYPDITVDPHAVVTQILDKVKSRTAPYDTNELDLIVEWLEDHSDQGISKEVVIIHGDYHPGNLILREETLVTIDWTNVTISDPRLELGFTTGILLAHGLPVDLDSIVNLYENLSGRKVNNLPYFIALAHIQNLMRMYSLVFEPEMTGEYHNDPEAIVDMFRPYASFMIEFIHELCTIDLQALRQGYQGE